MSLKLCKAKGNRPEPPEWDENDFDVLWEGQAVGRIYRRMGARDDAQSWSWSILIVTAPGTTTNGLAATLDEAKAAFSRNWGILMGRAG
jgi:hypothetical protein